MKAADRFEGNKLSKAARIVLYSLYTNIIICLAIYFSFVWLSRYSLLAAYMGNLAIIIIGLVLDEFIYKLFRSERLVLDIQKEGNVEKRYHDLQRLVFDGFVSFKTILFLFYVLILIVAQIAEFYPQLLPTDLAHFIFANRYSILILIAIDRLVGQFRKDRKEIDEISRQLKRNLDL